MLTFRHIKEEDFENIEKWLKFWKPNDIFIRDMYPSTGLVIYDSYTNTDLYAGFVWLSNSKLAQIGFIVRNPYTKIKNKQTLELLINGLFLYAKELGYDYVISEAESEHLKNVFESLGMINTSNGVSEYIIKIN
jgi:hypothetical protein